jgi:HK97 family phage major capsid protein
MDRKSTLLAEKEEHLKAARTIAAKAESENRDFNDEERGQVTAHVEKARESHNALKAMEGDAALVEEINSLGRPVGQLAKANPAGPGNRDRKTLGDKFTTDPGFKSWLSSVAPNGVVPDQMKGLNSPAVAFDSKALITGVSDTSAGSLVIPDNLGLQVGLAGFQRELTIRDLITVGQTDSDQIDYVRVTAITNNAAPVAEATGAGLLASTEAGGLTDAAGGLKPESGLTLEKVSTTVKTIAHWLPATKRALSDAAQIRTLIDTFLRYGLEEELEDQIVAGSGAGENFEGILTVAGTQAQAWDTNLLVTTRKARTKVRTVGRARPTAYVLNPADNERIDLLRDDSGGAGTGQFLFGSPAGLQVQTLWGLPRVESEAIPAGTGLVGDFRRAVLWDREQASIQVSDSHADFFVRNLVAILAEMRAGFGVIQPSAFVEIDLTA